MSFLILLLFIIIYLFFYVVDFFSLFRDLFQSVTGYNTRSNNNHLKKFKMSKTIVDNIRNRSFMDPLLNASHWYFPSKQQSPQSTKLNKQSPVLLRTGLKLEPSDVMRPFVTVAVYRQSIFIAPSKLYCLNSTLKAIWSYGIFKYFLTTSLYKNPLLSTLITIALTVVLKSFPVFITRITDLINN